MFFEFLHCLSDYDFTRDISATEQINARGDIGNVDSVHSAAQLPATEPDSV